VIFDEFHERSLEADLTLALALDSRRGLREDLKLLVMSATLDSTPVARLLGGAPVIETSGRAHPVSIHHQGTGGGPPAPAVVAGAVRTALEQGPGDVLVFLPGAREIRAVQGELARDCPALVCPLHGGLSPAEQDRAIRADPDGQRRVVLATNIAETSLTIEGVTTVVDSGLARRPRFHPNSGLSRLETVAVSRASAQQRAGRAGRLGPGKAVRLWSEAEHTRRQEFDTAEILEADLCPLALELAAWGVPDPAALDWLDPPPAGAWNQAMDLLRLLGAVDTGGHITAAGRRMAGMPAHPRLACMLDAAKGSDEITLAADLAAMLDGPDLPGAGTHGCDLGERVRMLAGARDAGRGRADLALARAERIAAQLRRAAGSPRAGHVRADDAGRLLLHGFPDRLAKRRTGTRGSFLLANGRGVRLAEHDTLAGEDYLVVPDLDAGATEARAFRAAAVEDADLREALGARVQRLRKVVWNPREEAVDALDEERVGAIVLGARKAAEVAPQEQSGAMLEGVRRLGLEALPWDAECRELAARITSLRVWQPDAGWPDLAHPALLETLDDWLGPFLNGITRREHLARVNLAAALRARVPGPLLARLEEGAPARLQVPGGSRVALHYRPGEAPVLAVKLQEMFGCTETPAVCWGQVPVQVHLLSPAGRPLHVTQDLSSFWRNAYPQVRKEMRGRYPKHPWPEDPLTAAPTRHARRRR
jgi:ATP-dependent helicase HrpB